MEIIGIIAISAGLLLVGSLFVISSLSWFRRDEVTDRLEMFVGETVKDTRPRETSIVARSLELRGNFLERTLYPFLRQISSLVGGLLPARRMANLDRRLQLVGNPMGLRAREFMGLQLVSIVLGGLFGFLIYSSDIQNSLWISIMIPVFFTILPTVWLSGRVRSSKNQIIKDLPDVIDMLSVCTTAGLGFDQAMLRVSEELHTQMSWELGRVVAEMEMGLTRRDALRNLAERLQVDELSSFVSMIVQSDQLGMSVANTLHVFAQQMRIEWRFRAQEAARKLPIKILFPIVFFIFPAMLAVILGPSIPAITGLFGTLN